MHGSNCLLRHVCQNTGIIAEKTGLGRAWIGVVLMASVTSLPELVTGITSVTYANVPDIAVGDVLEVVCFNMFILAFLDAFYKPMPISTKANQGHVSIPPVSAYSF